MEYAGRMTWITEGEVTNIIINDFLINKINRKKISLASIVYLLLMSGGRVGGQRLPRASGGDQTRQHIKSSTFIVCFVNTLPHYIVNEQEWRKMSVRVFD